MSPGRHDHEEHEKEEDLWEAEWIIEDVRDETEDKEDFEACEDNEPGEEQHSFVVSNSCTSQAITDERCCENAENAVSVHVDITDQELQIPISVLSGHHKGGCAPNHLYDGAHDEEHVKTH